MESPKPIGEDAVVAVAVNNGRTSQSTLKWAIENLLVGGGSVNLLHVRPRAQVFDTKVVSMRDIHALSGADVCRGLVEGYRELIDMQSKEKLLPFESYCRKKKIQSELVIIEDNELVKAIANYVLVNHVDVLVVGGESRNGVLKKLKGPDVATRISKKAPYFCTVYTVVKGKLQGVRFPSSTTHTFADNDVNSLHHAESTREPVITGQFTYCGSSVCSRKALLQSDDANSFEFRSPLQDHEHSDFHIGGLDASESDISFVSNDRDYSSSPSSNSSNWSLGSFEPSYAALSNSPSNLSVGSFAASPLDYGSMDESQRLRQELIRAKRMRDSLFNETSDEEILASKITSLKLEEEQRMKMVQRFPQSLSKLDHIR